MSSCVNLEGFHVSIVPCLLSSPSYFFNCPSIPSNVVSSDCCSMVIEAIMFITIMFIKNNLYFYPHLTFYHSCYSGIRSPSDLLLLILFDILLSHGCIPVSMFVNFVYCFVLCILETACSPFLVVVYGYSTPS